MAELDGVAPASERGRTSAQTRESRAVLHIRRGKQGEKNNKPGKKADLDSIT
jgi:hypothetical protein